MFKIGEFSKLSLVSVRMLRHYGELGLLMPEVTDIIRQIKMHMNYSVVEKEISNRYVTSVRKRIGSYQEEGMLWERSSTER